MHKQRLIPVVVLVFALLLPACSGTSGAPVETSGEEALTEPTEVNIAAIFSSVLEEPWNMAWKQSVERVAADPPHDLTINFDYTEDVTGADTERILREYAESGQYQIIWAHSAAYADDVGPMSEAFPDILWVAAMDSDEGGGNLYYVDMLTHEPAYLMGMLAGLTSETGGVGAVAAFPIPNVTTPINGFFDGARAVDSDIGLNIGYIESWYDPPKAAEAARAQIVAGADRLYGERHGVFDAAAEHGALAFGTLVDQNELAPDIVVSSSIAKWDPNLRYIIEEWWQHAMEGVAYDAPADAKWFTMAEGGSDLAPLHGFEDKLPSEVIDQVMEARQSILDGELVIEPRTEPPEVE